MYDETPQWLRVRCGDAANEAERETSKLFVVQQQYSMVLKLKGTAAERDQLVYLHIPSSNQLRVSENETGENIANVLDATSMLPKAAELNNLLSSFKCAWRLSESDEAGANGRGERLYAAARGFVFQRLHTNCSAHKCHTGASKTFALDTYVPVLSGIVHSCKTFWDRRFLETFYKCLDEEIATQLVYKRVSLISQSRAALTYKNHVLELWLPQQGKPKVRARGHFLAQALLNADWRWAPLTHLCVNCCSGREEAVFRIQKHVAKLARSLRVPTLCKGNWASWPLHLNLFGYLSHCHNLLPQVLQKALARFRTANPPAPAPQAQDNEADQGAVADDGYALEGLDEVAFQRQLRATSVRKASEFAVSAWPMKLWRLRACLGPQIRLMERILREDSQTMELSDLGRLLEGGQRSFSIVRLAGADHTHAFLLESVGTLFSESLWEHMPPTEQHQTELLRSIGRPAATIWQLLSHRLSLLPYQLFLLLRTPSLELAQSFIARPACQKDAFTLQLLERYPTAADLISRECLELLAGAAFLIRGSTFSTERCHSSNQRSARKRINTTVMEPHTLAMSHAANASARWLHPEWLRELTGVQARQQVAAKREAEPHEVLCLDTPPHKKRKRRGGGGPWRAYLHEQCSGQRLARGDVNVTALRDQYMSLPDAEMARLRQVGAAGGLTIA